jgi:hypothetical protein
VQQRSTYSASTRALLLTQQTQTHWGNYAYVYYVCISLFEYIQLVRGPSLRYHVSIIVLRYDAAIHVCLPQLPVDLVALNTSVFMRLIYVLRYRLASSTAHEVAKHVRVANAMIACQRSTISIVHTMWQCLATSTSMHNSLRSLSKTKTCIRAVLCSLCAGLLKSTAQAQTNVRAELQVNAHHSSCISMLLQHSSSDGSKAYVVACLRQNNGHLDDQLGYCCHAVRRRICAAVKKQFVVK